ncbi:MAG: LytTR family DNA-binding domain-containing protein [Oscillospiraceae bacterium]|nr:LytTR family DNA-binding domain-containing protein [Oscillospiraceae bacterium]
MRIAICDDENYCCRVLRAKLEAYAQKRALIFIYDNFSDGRKLLKSNLSYDLIFLDYKMRGLNGIDTARELRKRNDKTTIIFLTGIFDAVYDSFEVKAFRFLSKPINDVRLCKALDDFLASFNDGECLCLTDCPKIIKVEYDDIFYIEANEKSCTIHTLSKSIKYPHLLLQVEKLLPQDRFFRCHKSFIVGFKHVVSLEQRTITLGNAVTVDLSRNKVIPFKSLYIDYLRKYSFERV